MLKNLSSKASKKIAQTGNLTPPRFFHKNPGALPLRREIRAKAFTFLTR
jgi:hypothetical protein